VADLERALTEILACFRPGGGGFLTDLFSRRIDRILIAATKADHLHHESHDRLQAIVRRLADRAIKRADFSGATVDVLAMAAVRATREGTVKQGRETLPVIIGTPLARARRSAARPSTARPRRRCFPATCRRRRAAVRWRTHRNDTALARCASSASGRPSWSAAPDGVTLSLPHIRLDRALQFLIGDRLA
jgi:predicted YcjX-like family ATPase